MLFTKLRCSRFTKQAFLDSTSLIEYQLDAFL
jgi:hypothetical protein